MTDYEKMKKAYEASNEIIKGKMRKERAADLALLGQIADHEIIIVRGQYDRIEQVFDLVKIPHGLAEPYQLEAITLRPSQTLIINCPGSGFSKIALDKIKAFVEAGGFLFSTDWVLRNVLEVIFPGIVRYNERPTADDVVKVEVVDRSSPYLQGMFENEQDEPMWWLEGSSYPIEILDPARVQVLVRSREMAERYGGEPIVITFRHGEGTVFHLTSHYYLQRTELRSDRHKSPWTTYAKDEKQLDETDITMKADLDDVTLGEVESAYTSAQFMVNAMIERKKQQARKQAASKPGGERGA